MAGAISDKVVIYYRKKNNGEWYPEDRLRATIVGAIFFIPVSVLAAGLITHFVAGRTGLILVLICLFFNGLGVSWRPSIQLVYSSF